MMVQMCKNYCNRQISAASYHKQVIVSQLYKEMGSYQFYFILEYNWAYQVMMYE